MELLHIQKRTYIIANIEIDTDVFHSGLESLYGHTLSISHPHFKIRSLIKLLTYPCLHIVFNFKITAHLTNCTCPKLCSSSILYSNVERILCICIDTHSIVSNTLGSSCTSSLGTDHFVDGILSYQVDYRVGF